MSYIIGLDPGTKGGVCKLSGVDGKILDYEPFIVKKGKPDYLATMNMLQDYLVDPLIERIWIEDVHSLGGVSATSNFSFGFNYGWLIAQLMLYPHPYSTVPPKKWQKELWIDEDIVAASGKRDTKATSLACARRLFPGDTFIPKSCERCSVANDGVVDAALIAYYGYVNK